MEQQEIPEHYRKLIFYNWDDVYYLRNKPCVETEEKPTGDIVETINDYPAGTYSMYSNGVMVCKTIGGVFDIKIQ